MCLSDLTQLRNAIDPCNQYAGVLNQLSELCTQVTALTNSNEFANGTYSTTLVAATATQLEFSDAVGTNTGVLVGDDFVTTLTGLYQLNLNLDIPTTTVAENITVEINVNGVAILTTVLVDDGANTTTLSQPNVFFLDLDAGDTVNVTVTSPTGGVDAAGMYSFQVVYGS